MAFRALAVDVAGPLIGLMVPTLLVAGNRPFGFSSNLRHLCAACVRPRLDYFRYDVRRDVDGTSRSSPARRQARCCAPY